MSPLLQKIVKATKLQLSERKRRWSHEDLMAMASGARPVRSLKDALSGDFSVIAEHKHRSPTGGAMKESNLKECLAAYNLTPWISAISVLTEEDNFHGKLEDLQIAGRECPEKPILRKDFIVDEYQVLEARAFGADAVLLMAALHAGDPERLRGLLELTHSLGMEALVELGMGGAEPRELVKIIPPEASILGINARKFEGRIGVRAMLSRVSVKMGLGDKMTDLGLHERLRSLILEGKIAVAESGIHSAKDLVAARASNYNAALLGTVFLKGPESVDEVISDLGTAFLPSSGFCPKNVIYNS